MAKSNRSSSSNRPSSKIPKRSKLVEPIENEEDLQVENNQDDDEEIDEAPSRKSSRRGASSSRKGKPSSKGKPADNKQIRANALEQRQKTTNTRVIAIAVFIVLLLAGFMFGGNFIDNQRVEAVKNLNIDQNKTIQEFFNTEPIQAVANSGQSAITKMNRVLDNEITSDGPVATKNSLIAAIAYTFYRNPHITSNHDSLSLFKKILNKKDGNLNRKFTIQAIAYLPNGKGELETIIKSKDYDSESSLIALNSLPKLASGKIPGEVLAYALDKEDPEFLKKIFPLVNDNVEVFKEQPKAVSVLLKHCGNADESINKYAVELLGRCIFKPEHYEILKNSALSTNPKIKENALTSLLASSAERAAKWLAMILEETKDSPTKLRIIEKLGNLECAPYYSALVGQFKSTDSTVVVAALLAVGKLKNTPDKGLKEVVDCLQNDKSEIKIAAVKAISGFEYRKAFNYTETPDQIPTFALIKLIDSPDDALKKEVITSLEKISGERQNSVFEWKDWFAKEKMVLDLLIEMEVKHKSVQEKFKKTMFKEAKAEYKKMDAIFNTIFNDHSKRWKEFDKYMAKKGEDFLLLKVAVNKASPIDD